jgi:hypothetical protein
VPSLYGYDGSREKSDEWKKGDGETRTQWQTKAPSPAFLLPDDKLMGIKL